MRFEMLTCDDPNIVRRLFEKYGAHIHAPFYDNGSGDSDPPSDPAPSDDDPPTSKDGFTPDQQKKVDEIVQKRLARDKKKLDETRKQLETLKSTSKLTAEERDTLQSRIEELETMTMTEKELAAKRAKEESTKHEKQLESVTGERDLWRSRFETSTIEREIVDAASRKETRAYNPSQVVSLLSGNTKLVEEVVDGQPTGKFVTRVRFNGRDSENKPVEMDLTVQQAVDEMLKMPDLYGNLFESGLKDGLGSNNVPGTGPLGATDIKSQADYKKNREKLKETVK